MSLQFHRSVHLATVCVGTRGAISSTTVSAAVTTPSDDVESKIHSVRKQSAGNNDTIGKLRAEVVTCRDQIDHNRCRTRDQYSPVVY